MKKILILLCIVVVYGCAGDPARFSFEMIEPATQMMEYQDEKIRIDFFMEANDDHLLTNDWEEMSYVHYSGVGFDLRNKTDEVLTIDWNKISFTDYSGSSGRQIMHKGMRFEDCSSPKAVTTVPPKSVIREMIVPCYALTLPPGRYARWEISMLPDPQKYSQTEFGVFMPLLIGDEPANYNFRFRGVNKESIAKPSRTPRRIGRTRLSRLN